MKGQRATESFYFPGDSHYNNDTSYWAPNVAVIALLTTYALFTVDKGYL